jgi:glycosyltransferase involved in cell wall biosynthesis
MTTRPALPICVDGRMLGGEGTGVTSYAATLIRVLDEAGAPPLVLFGGAPAGAASRTRRLLRQVKAALTAVRRARPIAHGNRVSALIAPDLFGQAYIHFRLYGRLMPVRLPGPPGIMHWTYPVPLRASGWRNIYTVHDVIPLTSAALTPIDPQHHRRLLRAVAGSADRLVTVSDAARRDTVRELGCAEDFVCNTHQTAFVDDPSSLAPPGEWGAGDYYLFCGAIEPRKNLERIVAAHRASGSRRPLLIAGPEGWHGAAIRRSIEGSGVVILGFQPREALLRLIRHARALLFPTLAEGFGLPVLEAMALGTPVVTSAGQPTAEVAGDAALLVDPLNGDQIADAIRRLDTHEALCRRLSEAGRARAARFAPALYAERLLDLYRDVAQHAFPR